MCNNKSQKGSIFISEYILHWKHIFYYDTSYLRRRNLDFCQLKRNPSKVAKAPKHLIENARASSKINLSLLRMKSREFYRTSQTAPQQCFISLARIFSRYNFFSIPKITSLVLCCICDVVTLNPLEVLVWMCKFSWFYMEAGARWSLPTRPCIFNKP